MITIYVSVLNSSQLVAVKNHIFGYPFPYLSPSKTMLRYALFQFDNDNKRFYAALVLF